MVVKGGAAFIGFHRLHSLLFDVTILRWSENGTVRDCLSSSYHHRDCIGEVRGHFEEDFNS